MNEQINKLDGLSSYSLEEQLLKTFKILQGERSPFISLFQRL